MSGASKRSLLTASPLYRMNYVTKIRIQKAMEYLVRSDRAMPRALLYPKPLSTLPECRRSIIGGRRWGDFYAVNSFKPTSRSGSAWACCCKGSLKPLRENKA